MPFKRAVAKFTKGLTKLSRKYLKMSKTQRLAAIAAENLQSYSESDGHQSDMEVQNSNNSSSNESTTSNNRDTSQNISTSSDSDTNTNYSISDNDTTSEDTPSNKENDNLCISNYSSTEGETSENGNSDANILDSNITNLSSEDPEDLDNVFEDSWVDSQWYKPHRNENISVSSGSTSKDESVENLDSYVNGMKSNTANISSEDDPIPSQAFLHSFQSPYFEPKQNVSNIYFQQTQHVSNHVSSIIFQESPTVNAEVLKEFFSVSDCDENDDVEQEDTLVNDYGGGNQTESEDDTDTDTEAE